MAFLALDNIFGFTSDRSIHMKGLSSNSPFYGGAKFASEAMPQLLPLDLSTVVGLSFALTRRSRRFFGQR